MKEEGHLVFYRKYRPKTFGEIKGQDHIVGILSNAVKLNRVAHALLFSGPRGTGKTSVARILAREVGCDDIDLAEIDAASSRGIDEIRALKEAVRTVPFKSPFKVYIVDEVHMMTKEAFNALLKTLEEPPAHAIFILATTDPEKVPETIVSRCQHFEFRKIPDDVIISSLAHIAKEEKIKIDDEALALLAVSGDGSFRDAQGMLDQLAGMGLGAISGDEVRTFFGIPQRELVENFVSALLQNDVENSFKAVQAVAAKNLDIRMFLKLVMRSVRFLMILKIAPSMAGDIEKISTKTELKFILAKANGADLQNLRFVLASLIDAYDATRRAYLPQLPLELAIIKIAEELKLGCRTAK